MHLVLDLDETLVYGTSINVPSIPRPNLHEFLKFCFEKFETVNIWTAAGDEWWQFNKEIHFKDYNFDLVYTRKRCTFTWDYSNIYARDPTFRPYKPLVKMWKRRQNSMTRDNTIIVDDDKFNSHKNYGNAILIKPFVGCSDDTELIKIQEKLTKVIDIFETVKSVRSIDIHSL